MKKSISLSILSTITLALVSCTTTNNSIQSSSNYSNSTTINSTNESSSNQSSKPIENKKVGVVYFSATNNTKNVADLIANYYDITAISIEASEPYSSSDLNYNDSSSRVYKENQDDSIRPGIKNDIDITSYDYLYLGYPIWWGKAPKILYTFVESKDFENKTIIPFCTSASSSIGSSAVNLAKNQNGNWLSGRRFSSSTTSSEISSWIDSLNLKI